MQEYSVSEEVVPHGRGNLDINTVENWKDHLRSHAPTSIDHGLPTNMLIYSYSPRKPGTFISLNDVGSLLSESGQDDLRQRHSPFTFNRHWERVLAYGAIQFDPDERVIGNFALNARLAELKEGQTQVANDWHIDMEMGRREVFGFGTMISQHYLTLRGTATDHLPMDTVVGSRSDSLLVINRFKRPVWNGQVGEDILFPNQDALTDYVTRKKMVRNFDPYEIVMYDGSTTIHRGRTVGKGEECERFLINFTAETLVRNEPQIKTRAFSLTM